MKFTTDRQVDTKDGETLVVFEIGDDMAETPEGFLLCRSVPIARIGTQQYLNEELEPDAEGGPDGIIHVERNAEDVFHLDTIASFEGKSVTDDHPEEFLDPDNVQDHDVGVVLNVRRGDLQWNDFLLADLLIKKRSAIDAVRAGKRQVSCGYGSDYESKAPGRARQHNIIGNHVALVVKGRCGPSCAIGDNAMAEKKVKKNFMDRLRDVFDEYKDGETGLVTFKDEKLPSESGMESHSSVGSDTHIHIHAGPDGSTTIAPTTDKKAKDKKSKDDEGTAEEMEESETEDADKEDDKDDDKKSFMDAMSKAYDSEMKKIKDKKAPTKDKKAKDADKDKDEEEDKETKDEASEKDVSEEGEAESEGSVESADADKEEKEDDKDDKKAKDKKGTKDSAPLKGDFQQLKSDVEILSPGLSLPTFDGALPQTKTMDAMCLLRRRSLAASLKTEDGKQTLEMLNGGKPLDLKKLTCDNAEVFFNSAVTFARDRNSTPSGLKKARTAQASAPKSVADFNRTTADFYAAKLPKSQSK